MTFMKPLIFFAVALLSSMTSVYQSNAGGEQQERPAIMVAEGMEKKGNSSSEWRSFFNKWRRKKREAGSAMYAFLMDERLSEVRDVEANLSASESVSDHTLTYRL